MPQPQEKKTWDFRTSVPLCIFLGALITSIVIKSGELALASMAFAFIVRMWLMLSAESKEEKIRKPLE